MADQKPIKRKLELLAPAKDLACGIAAIDHGADAVYIGAQRFGAREAAGNSIADIEALCRYAHPFYAKVYVTVNTLIFDDELEATHHLLNELRLAGVDGILVQDMALVHLAEKESADSSDNATNPLPFPALHASTQTDNRTPEKVAWLHQQGFQRVVLARELSLSEIAQIHQAVPDVELEVFVHGALCVSYSGQCYASAHCFGRSANRGACAQFCRMKFDLIDANGEELISQRHLLSLKDLCQLDELEALAHAGASSFKIEGRLKDIHYVKNVVAAYNKQLNKIVERHPDLYERASKGRVDCHFEPNLKKTFNRGYTHYFLHGRQQDIVSFDTPKAIGEYVGRVTELKGRCFTVAGTAAFANGDGLCFLNSARELEGFRVNKVEGNKLYPLSIPRDLRPGTALYRNNDVVFERLLSGKTAERRLPVTMTLMLQGDNLVLELSEGQHITCATLPYQPQQANTPQRENIVRQLSKLGGTPYYCDKVTLEEGIEGLFIPSSQLAELRRKTVEQALNGTSKETTQTERKSSPSQPTSPDSTDGKLPLPQSYANNPYLYNVTNRTAQRFYAQEGVQLPILERAVMGHGDFPLMQCRHCLRYALGYCVKHGGKKPIWKEPLSLRLSDGRKFRLQFDCKNCQMNVYAQ